MLSSLCKLEKAEILASSYKQYLKYLASLFTNVICFTFFLFAYNISITHVTLIVNYAGLSAQLSTSAF